MRRATPYAVQFLANAGSTVAVVYVPLLARDLGASGSTIGLLVATYQAALLVANVIFGRWADFGNRRAFVVAGTALSAAALAAHVFVHGLAGLFVARALTGLCMGVFPSALVAYYYEGSKRLGRFSSSGALGWGAGSLAAGAVALGWLFPFAGALTALGAVVAFAGLRDQHVRLSQPFFDARVLGRNWRLYLSYYLRHAGASSIWAIFPVYMSDVGASRLWVGILYGINPFAQFLFMNLLERGRRSRSSAPGWWCRCSCSSPTGSCPTTTGWCRCRYCWRCRGRFFTSARSSGCCGATRSARPRSGCCSRLSASRR